MVTNEELTLRIDLEIIKAKALSRNDIETLKDLIEIAKLHQIDKRITVGNVSFELSQIRTKGKTI